MPARFLLLGTRSRAALKAENLFLRKQLAFYLERKARPRRADDATRLALALLSTLFAWKQTLVIVRPETWIRWHRKCFQPFRRCKSKPSGTPRVPADLRELITGQISDCVPVACRLLGGGRAVRGASCDLGLRPSETRGKVLANGLLRVQLPDPRE